MRVPVFLRARNYNFQNTDTGTYALCIVQAWWWPVRMAETYSDVEYK